MRQQSQHNQNNALHVHLTKEVAQYDYCPLVWWHEQYDPLVKADNEELFAQMVQMEHLYGQQATSLPDYQVIEQLLVRRGAFEAEGLESQPDDVAYAGEFEEDDDFAPPVNRKMRVVRTIAFTSLGLGSIMLLASLLMEFMLH